MKSAEEIMNILEAYDLTGSLRDAAELVLGVIQREHPGAGCVVGGARGFSLGSGCGVRWCATTA